MKHRLWLLGAGLLLMGIAMRRRLTGDLAG